MDRISQAVYDLLWESATSCHTDTVHNCQTRGVVVNFDSINFHVGLDQQHAEFVIDRFGIVRALRAFYTEIIKDECCLSCTLYDDKWFIYNPEHWTYTPIEAQRKRWKQTDAFESRIGQPKDPSGYVYLIKGKRNYYKIGKSVNPVSRIKHFDIVLPFEIEVEHLIHCSDYSRTERELHHKFQAKRVNGEWFRLDPEDVAYIKTLQNL